MTPDWCAFKRAMDISMPEAKTTKYRQTSAMGRLYHESLEAEHPAQEGRAGHWLVDDAEGHLGGLLRSLDGAVVLAGERGL